MTWPNGKRQLIDLEWWQFDGSVDPIEILDDSEGTVVSCADDSCFTFNLDNGETQDCAWLTKKYSSATTRIVKYCTYGSVKFRCQSACASCGESCADDFGFTFTLDIGKTKIHSWLGNTSTAKRIASYCSRGESKVDSHGMILADFEAGAACPATCGFCL